MGNSELLRTCFLAWICLAVATSATQAQAVRKPQKGFVPLHTKMPRRPAADPNGPTVKRIPARHEAAVDFKTPEVGQIGHTELVSKSNAMFTSPQFESPLAETPTGRFAAATTWLRADFLFWSTDGANAIPLATTSPDGTPREDAGVLGRIGTSTLFGGGELNESDRTGGRITVGMWLDSCQSSGLELSYLALEDDTESFQAGGAASNILARPFFNAQLGQEDSRLIDFEGLVEGTLSVVSETEFQTLEINFLRSTMQACGGTTAVLIGYRYAELQDALQVAESTQSLAGPTIGTRFDLIDRFATDNKFHGGQLGMLYRSTIDPEWSIDVLGKLALGSTNSRVDISGQTTTTTAAGDSSTAAGGLLAQATNIGTQKQDKFATMLEIGVSLKRNFQCGLKCNVGYSFLLWSDLLRAAEQIDGTINPSQIPPGTLTGPARPTVPAGHSEFWAQGLTAGIEYHF